MRRLTLLLALAACACGDPKPLPVDRFVWEMQNSEYDPAQSDLRGEITEEQFQKAIKGFSWFNTMGQQKTMTYAVTDLLSDRTLYISSDHANFGFRVGLVLPDPKSDSRRINRYRIDALPRVDSLLTGFFTRDMALVNRQVNGFGQSERLAEPITRKEHEARVRKYMNNAEQR